MSRDGNGDRTGVEALLAQKAAAADQQETKRQTAKGADVTSALGEYEENIAEMGRLTQESEKAGEDIKKIKKFQGEHTGTDDAELVAKLEELKERQKEITNQIGSLKRENEYILRQMNNDPNKKFRSDVKPELMRKIVSSETRKLMETGQDYFNVRQLGDEQTKKHLRASPDFVSWVNERAAEIYKAAEAEIAKKKAEINEHPIHGYSDRYKRNESYQEFIDDNLAALRAIATSQQNDSKRFFSSMRGASKETLAKQDSLVRKTQSFLQAVQRNLRNNDIPELLALSQIAEPVTRENCEAVVRQINAYFRAEANTQSMYQASLRDYKDLVQRNNQSIEWQEKLSATAYAVVNELKEK